MPNEKKDRKAAKNVQSPPHKKSNRKQETTLKAKTPGVILPDCIYRLDEFLARVGWSEHAWRTARHRGLKFVNAGGRKYVRGRDFFEYVDGLAEQESEVHS